MSLPEPLARYVAAAGGLAVGEDWVLRQEQPPPCEGCGVPTWDWRSVGWYCSEECKDEDARKITL